MIRLVSGVIEALRDDTYAAQDEYRFKAPPGVQHPQIRSLPFRDGLDYLLNPRLHDSAWRIWGKVSVPWLMTGEASIKRRTAHQFAGNAGWERLPVRTEELAYGRSTAASRLTGLA